MPPKANPTSVTHPHSNSRFTQSSLSSLPSPSSASASSLGSSPSSAPTASSSSSSAFVAGRFPCPICSKTFDSAPQLIQHVHKHIDGMLPGKPSVSAFADIGYSACRFCRHLFKRVGQHEPYCAKKLSQPPPAPDSVGENLPLPSLDEIFSSYRPTLSFVPAAHRQAWARVLFLELDRVAIDNSSEAWTRLFMLPKCVLVVPKRSGKRNRGDRYSISDLCAFWEQGQLNWLWSRQSRSQPESSRSPDTNRAFACAIQHARCGRYGRACAALSTSGLAPDSSATLSKLESKHPQADAPDFAMEPVDSPLVLSADFDLLGILSSFSKEVGTDGTNFRIQHLLDAKDAHLPSPYLPRLRAVINLLLAGKAPQEIQPYLAGARLTALAKGKGDVRPIAAGNIFRRIASKCACSLLKVRAKAKFGGLQLGVACPAGAEKIVHSMRNTLAERWSDPDFLILKVDFSNAFNNVSRQVLLEECRKTFPDLLPWAYYCYGSTSLLFHQDNKIKSCVGVQQGDPLGPLLFCLVLHVIVQKIAETCPDLDLHRWYLDDGILCGDAGQVVHAFGIISRFGPDSGLILNLAKCELFSPDPGSFSSVFHSPLLGNIEFPRELSQRSVQPNFLLLGAPLGDAEFCTGHVHSLREANKPLLDSLVKLEDPQVALHLLRTCMSFCKYVYVSRITPPHLIFLALEQCDRDIMACLESFAAIDLSVPALRQARLALSLGGLGLRSLVRHCTSAFISSHLMALPDLLTENLRRAFDMYADSLGMDHMDENEISSMIVKPPSQRKLSARLDRYERAALVNGADLADSIRLSSLLAERAGAWLQAIPARGPIDLTLAMDEMQAALKHRLGLALAGPGDLCPQCDPPAELDILGHHHITCSTGGFVTVRHNRIRDALFSLSALGGFSPDKERGGMHDDLSRPADLFLPSYSLGKPAALDVTVVSPLSVENLSVAGVLDVVSKAEDEKHELYDSKCKDLGWHFIPLAVDSYGHWGREAHKCFARLASRIAVRTKVSSGVALSSLYNTLGVVLARQNARAILARSEQDLGAREVRQLASFRS